MSSTRQVVARAFIAGMALAALACFALAFANWQSRDLVKFICYLAAALLASSFKVSLPGIEGTLSMNFLFTLVSILEMSLPETLLIGLVSNLGQVYWKPARRPKPLQLIFNLSHVTICSAVAYGTYKLVSIYVLRGEANTFSPLALLLAAVAHFSFGTLAMSTIIGLTEEKPIAKVWSDSYLSAFPYYLAGAAIAGFVSLLNRHIGWQALLLVLPPIYLMYRSYRLYLSKLETEKQHAEKVSNIHLRTIEALALAIEAKDQTTGEHLQRVRVYAMEIARELGLSEDDTEALRAASVLHDIGKLAVPEHIIAKPGKLTPEEFEKMKIHPIVGAEILEQVDFPYPVVPIVRTHHEKWDGSGYPSGLKGEAIPIGARILSAVDCLDALASDRQYRKALPLHDAMAKVASEAGISFDPQIVAILQRRYVELERLATSQHFQAPPKLSTDIKVERGAAPDAGFAKSEHPTATRTEPDAAGDDSLTIARKKGDELVEFIHRLGSSLPLDETLSLISVLIKRHVPYATMAVYVLRDNVLAAAFVDGENPHVFSGLTIPVGEGLAGWVAQNSKPIMNGNPLVEPGYTKLAVNGKALHSALAVPLQGTLGVVAVLALYRISADAFSRDDQTVLQAMVSKLGAALENSMRDSANTRVSETPTLVARAAAGI